MDEATRAGIPPSAPACLPRELILLLTAISLVAGGCASQNWVTVRKVPRNPLAGPLRLLSESGPQPTGRTLQFLRQSDLEEIIDLEPRQMFNRLEQHVAAEPTAQGTYAISELTYVEGIKARDLGDESLALDMFGAAVAHAYMYLLDDRFAPTRNAYDPQFRRACDVYNGALEETLRIVAKHGNLRPGYVHTINTGHQRFDVEVITRGRWKLDEIDHFEFANDYEVNGLVNHHHTFGLGVPLIAVRKTAATDSAVEQFYPPGVTFPITAFLRVNSHPSRSDEADSEHVHGGNICHCALELFDPLHVTDVVDRGRNIPLESDLSVPLAFFLNQPAFQRDNIRNIAYLGFLNPNLGRDIQGLYMLEPYEPHKIPVVFVHGLASSPVTWTDMYNDLRAHPEIGKHYQFWFYFYATGQPFWVSATQLRRDLAEALKELDPNRNAPTLDQLVLVGHSMGGLLSKLQTIDSRDDYWQLVSDRSPEELQANDEARFALLSTLYFRPSPSVRRVVTIGTPHRGSYFANRLTRFATRTIAELPSMLVDTKRQLVRDNPDLFKDTELLSIDTGVDSLIPESPFLPVMLKSPSAPWVKYHNIVGLVDDEDLLGRISGEEGDGVVSLTSARIPNVESEVIVPAGHVAIHRHPKAIREVERILRQHLRQMDVEDQHSLASFQNVAPRLHGPRRGYRLEDHYRPTGDGVQYRVTPAGHQPPPSVERPPVPTTQFDSPRFSLNRAAGSTMNDNSDASRSSSAHYLGKYFDVTPLPAVAKPSGRRPR